MIQLKESSQIYSYEWANSQNEYTKSGFFERLTKIYHADIIDAYNDTISQRGIQLVKKEVNRTSEFCKYLSFHKKNSQLSFSPVKMIKSSDSLLNYTIVLWMKPHLLYGVGETILSLCYLDNNVELIRLKIDASGYLYWMEDMQKKYQSTQQLDLEKWNMLVISIQRKISNANAYDLSLSANGKQSTTIQPTIVPDSISDFHQEMKMKVGNGNEENLELQMPFELYKIMIFGDKFTHQNLLECYQQSMKYIGDTSLSYKYVTTSWVDKSQTQHGDLFTFRGTKESIYGKSPIASRVLDSSYIQNLSREYHYDSGENRHIYGIYRAEDLKDICLSGYDYLAYDLELEDTFTIAVRVKEDTLKTLRDAYLMSFIKNETMPLGIKILATEQIHFVVNNETILALRFDTDIWHTFLIQRNQRGELITILDGKKVNMGVQDVNLANCLCYLGCNKEDNEIVDILCGEIENFYYSNTAWTIEEKQVESMLTPKVYQKKYDHWNRLVKSQFKTHQHTFIKTYTYFENPIPITQLVKSEIGEDTQIDYQYENDKIVKICTRKKNDLSFIHQVCYTYDQLGRLVKEITYKNETTPQTEISYMYDSYQNMIKKVIKDYETGETEQIEYQYNTTYKTRVDDITIGANTIHLHYDSNYALYLRSITKNNQVYQLDFEGVNLTKIGNHINYIYDALGRRIEKKVYEKSTTYVYDDTKIIEMHFGEEYIRYNYDENNQLISFTYQGKIYYYEKDILGNINGILNEEGKKVVRYQYDAYGNHQILNPNGTINDDDTFIGNINRIRYKGYYYDVETGWFWLSSRYYSPELCRFIQPADVSALNPSSINGLNLYSYANNNPINIHYNTTLASAGIVGGGVMSSSGSGGLSSPSRNLPSVPGWLESLSKGLDHGFTMINPIRSAIACLQFTDLWDLMRLDGVTELPGTLSKVATGIGWGLSIAGGVIAGYEKYASGASLSSAIAGGVINAGISIGAMYASTAIATAAMGALAASSLAIPGGIIIVGGAIIAVAAGIAINHFFTKLEIGGNTIEGHLNDFVDWLIFWD